MHTTRTQHFLQETPFLVVVDGMRVTTSITFGSKFLFSFVV